MACYFLENHSRIARLKQPSFENLENAVSRGGSLRKAAPLLGIESLNVLYFPFSEATPIFSLMTYATTATAHPDRPPNTHAMYDS